MKLENALSSESYTVHKIRSGSFAKFLHATSLIRCMQPKLPASDNGAEPELFTIQVASKVQATGEAQGGATVYEDLFNP